MDLFLLSDYNAAVARAHPSLRQLSDGGRDDRWVMLLPMGILILKRSDCRFPVSPATRTRVYPSSLAYYFRRYCAMTGVSRHTCFNMSVSFIIAYVWLCLLYWYLTSTALDWRFFVILIGIGAIPDMCHRFWPTAKTCWQEYRADRRAATQYWDRLKTEVGRTVLVQQLVCHNSDWRDVAHIAQDYYG